jgi:hypothetical protein
MKNRVWQDKNGWTHIDWELGEVTPRMLDWFWCNMDKCDYLWHPNQHNGFEWMKGYGVSELKTPLNSIHIAPQTWADGVEMRPYIRIEPLENVPAYIRETIKYDHVVIVAGISIFGQNVHPSDPPMAWRVHQWQKTDDGVVGMSSGMTAEGYEVESGMVWAAHAVEEVGNWEVFLPDLYRLYRVITRSDICPYYSFRIEGLGKEARYAEL